MPWFIPALAATATFALARKIVARYWHGQHAQYAQADPPGLRTVARFSTDTPDDILLAIAAELSRDLGSPQAFEVTKDAVRVRIEEDERVEIVRLARHGGGTFTVELTRAWTGVYLGEQARRLLAHMHEALAPHAVAWFARQDRDFAEPFATPVDDEAISAR